MPPASSIRQLQKQRTRRALQQAVLELLEFQSFDSLSLRQVAGQARITPTAFYRHFRDLEDLGLALVDTSFGTLRATIRTARQEPDPGRDAIHRSVEILAEQVREHSQEFRFITRERNGGVAVLRQAIRRELRLFASELATDLAHIAPLGQWPTEDLTMLAELVVHAMVAAAESLLDTTPDRVEAAADFALLAERQLRLIFVGAASWRPSSVAAFGA